MITIDKQGIRAANNGMLQQQGRVAELASASN